LGLENRLRRIEGEDGSRGFRARLRRQDCLGWKRTFDVDKEQVGDAVRLHLAGALAQAGIDPAAVQVVGADFKVEDTFVVEPETCHFHDANLTQQAKFVFQGPKGNKLEVVHTSKQTSHAEYPPPS
jgi:hypothetical protein